MKNVIQLALVAIGLCLVIGTNSHASTSPSKKLLLPVEYREFETSRMCPKNVVCITDGTNVRIQYALTSCIGELVNVQYDVEIINGGKKKTATAVVRVAATEEYDPTKEIACLVIELREVTIPLIGFYGNVEVKDVMNQATAVKAVP